MCLLCIQIRAPAWKEWAQEDRAGIANQLRHMCARRPVSTHVLTCVPVSLRVCVHACTRLCLCCACVCVCVCGNVYGVLSSV